MTVGTKSLLFGVHQFIWHPVTVLFAWIYLYKRLPGLRVIFCIVVHDWGYWGKENMDGVEGETHPELGANIAGNLFGQKYYELCLYHSRNYAKTYNEGPSKLCWADKLSVVFEPWWMYISRAMLSGEIKEYRQIAHRMGALDISKSHHEWFIYVHGILVKLANEKRGDAAPYTSDHR